jgi:hypothetical protein
VQHVTSSIPEAVGLKLPDGRPVLQTTVSGRRGFSRLTRGVARMIERGGGPDPGQPPPQRHHAMAQSRGPSAPKLLYAEQFRIKLPGFSPLCLVSFMLRSVVKRHERARKTNDFR